ncbi:GNAT family N-acetyltransferase [Stenotrophomonas rhizophila]|uniref:GNAT family N-acetyltransferase n=1 Tax=Stenotrophomonas rhizophila TaxID=216778 RepID=UPI003397C896
MSRLSLHHATPDDAERLFHLMQFYYFEASAWSGEAVRPDGLFDCDRSDVESSLRDDPQWARLLFVDDALAGFVLVDQVEREGRHYPELADLFVLPTYRRQGLAAHVVKELVRPGDGQWLLAVFRGDVTAHAYWLRTLPRLAVPFVALDDEDATFHLFLIGAPARG